MKIGRDYLQSLQKEIDQYLSTGKVGRLLSRIKNLNARMAWDMKEQVWIKLNTLGVEDKELMEETAKGVLKGYSGLGEKVDRDIKKVLYDKSLDVTEKKKVLEHKMQGFRAYANTWAMTGEGAINSASRMNKAMNAGVKYFKFTGPIPERPFCKEHYGKTYTLDEIQQMDNGQGLSVLTFKGGWNCRHEWIAVPGREDGTNVIPAGNMINNNNRNNNPTDRLNELRTHEELREWARNNIAGDLEAMTEFPVEDLRATYKAIYEINQKYGLPKLNMLIEHPNQNNASYVKAFDLVKLGKNVVSSMNNSYERRSDERYVYETRAGRSLSKEEMHSYFLSNNLEDVAVHELGHRFHRKFNELELNELYNLNIHKSSWKKYKIGRASDDSAEYLAEMFSRYYHGKPIPRELKTAFRNKEVLR